MESYMKTKNGRVWYKLIGNPRGTPLILVHGGPGYPHNYLKPLEALSNRRKVLFYDQLGCGLSGKSSDKSLWTLKLFTAELGQLVKHLGFEEYHLLGQSWGAAVAVSHAVKNPKGLRSVILSNPCISVPVWKKDAEKLISQLPSKMGRAIKEYEKNRKSTKAFKEASREFYRRYVFRMGRDPKPVRESRKGMNVKMYTYMWGPEEYWATGTLRSLDLTKSLDKIKVPALLLSGRYDEATPSSLKLFASRMADARVKIFNNSAHFPFWNEKKKYIAAVEEFLEDQAK